MNQLKKIIWIALFGTSICVHADEDATKQLQALNQQVQSQLQKLQTDQQKQIQTMNQQLQAQMKKVQSSLETQIQTLNTQMKKNQADVQKQIQELHAQTAK